MDPGARTWVSGSITELGVGVAAGQPCGRVGVGLAGQWPLNSVVILAEG